MRGEGAALQDEAGAAQLEMKGFHQTVESIGSALRPGPDDLIPLPVFRYLDRQIEGFSLHPSGANNSLLGIGLAQEGQREVDLFGGDGFAAGAARRFACPVRQRSRGSGRRPEGEEQAHSVQPRMLACQRGHL